MQCLKAKITGHETTMNKKIVFILEVKDEATHKVKVSKLRYSEFKDIHDELQNIISKLKLHLSLPEFPSRKVFGSTSKSEEAILDRKKDLTNYVNDLLGIEKLRALEIMKKYYVPTLAEQTEKISQQVNIQICIDRYTLIDDTVHYYVRLRDLNSHEEWTFKSRYSELRRLHESLLESKIRNLPPFPKKKIFGMTNDSPQDIESRREQLEKYFNQVFDIKEVLNSETISFFIEESKKEAQKDKYFQAMRKKKKEM